jgi:type IV pilus assembly protein PilE
MFRPYLGFSLIELMVTVAIVSILATIAYPSYVEHVRKGHRAAAQEHLMDIAQRQQQYFLDTRDYAPDIATLNMTTPTDVGSRYTIAIVPDAGPPPSFTVTATAKGAQLADGDLSIDSAGNKTPPDKW